MDDLLDKLSALLGPGGVVTGGDMAPFAFDWRKIEESTPSAVLRPRSTAEVADVVRLCGQAGVPLVPQGGNTGLMGGTVAKPGALLLNLGRMDRIRDIDPLGYTVTAEAGCILANVQAAAAGVDRLFPLSLGAEGTCTIGGNLSTNAGGILTIRYGNARDLVLGLEVVLPDGRVWNGLRSLRKDNTGYDLKHLFMGAEGTLGIITAATCKLFPRPRQVETALVAVPDPAAAVDLLARLRGASSDALTAFELMPRFGIDGAKELLGRDVDPLAAPAPWYVLAELTAGTAGPALREQAEGALAAALEGGTVLDATFAESEEKRRQLWLIREGLPEIGRAVGGAVHHDVSVPVARVPDLITLAGKRLEKLLPGIRPYPFGHVADGNIHYNVARPRGMETKAYLDRAKEITATVHGTVRELGGSISAEHGIGSRKREEMAVAKDPVELDLMRAIKGLLDPRGIMNPGKVLP
ncbi:FAD-binding oxidoreductase [Aerophototrophica crusticola]|uniref:FAD-binding oxidoreductase n=1 Tax=Aerophototrophica crusticola TaxID=1709002 RepID=A0A858R862_9PROT|nr:FAD-binding oxidoreductase [Rhodospirillaceae bacterium B3]